mmetsp:Transcript_42921/g.99995  ORF Transcript_42921/g.99995 Transcript_42921/m.99995 type:complete len:427 (-) Transcript_42921:232-1512(-)
MRNIALLEWGPASLFYLQPRELIKVRTRWLQGGPVLPPFLSTLEEAKAHDPDLTIRYAFSAFEDLNGAIRNLRRCFGFPYQEYIGYMNTLTHQYRTRREHEGLIDRIRRWAMFGNVDAVLWIDYAKANQPPGSFKMGPRESRPFSPAHMQICAELPSSLGIDDANEESEAAWSEQEPGEEDRHHGGHQLSEIQVQTVPANQIREPGALRPLPPRRLPKQIARTKPAYLLRQSLSKMCNPSDKDEMALAIKIIPDKEDKLGDKGKHEAEKEMLRIQLQEEIVPVAGSIYARSIVPGPGYYGSPRTPGHEKKAAASFGRKGASAFDQIKSFAAKLPGPGQYKEKPSMTDEKVLAKQNKKGGFGKSPKLVTREEAFKKLPFISKLASTCEGFGLHSAGSFHCVAPDEVCKLPRYVKPPEFSFGKARRPF